MKKISFNHPIDGGVDIQLLRVDSLGTDGFPARFKPESTYSATGLRYLPDMEAAAFLPEHIRPEFLKYAAIKDSVIKNKINDTLLAGDTTYWENGGILYRRPGIHQSIEWDKAYHKTDEITYRHIPNKKLRTFNFGKNNKRYRWRAGAGDWMEVKSTISGFKLAPGRWYTTRFNCRYGLLTSGYCTLFFSTDEKGKITCKRIDKENDGPF